MVGHEECGKGWRKIRSPFIFLLTKYMESLNIPPLRKLVYKNLIWKFKGVSFEYSLLAGDLV